MAFRPQLNHASNTQYEQTVLAMIARDTYSISKHDIHAELFFDGRNRQIFLCIDKIAHSGQQRITAAEIIHKATTNKPSKIEQVGGAEYVETVISQVNNDAYNANAVKVVKESFRQRMAMMECETFLANVAGKSEDELLAMFNDVASKVFKNYNGTPAKSAANVMEEIAARYEKYQQTGENEGLMLGIEPLDTFLDGVQPAYFVLGALSSVGKTSLAVLSFWNMVKQGHRCVFFSQEMTAREIIEKIITIETGIPIGSTSSGKMTKHDHATFKKTMPMITAILEERAKIYDDSAMTIGDIRAKSLAANRTWGHVDAIFVDYIQNIDSDIKTNSSFERVTDVSKRLKGLGKDLNTLVFALSQLTPDAKSDEPTPMMLRDSKQIAQDADIILLLSRLEHRDTRMDRADKILANFAKGRSKGEGRIELLFNPTRIKFDRDFGGVVIHEPEGNPFEDGGPIYHGNTMQKTVQMTRQTPQSTNSYANGSFQMPMDDEDPFEDK